MLFLKKVNNGVWLRRPPVAVSSPLCSVWICEDSAAPLQKDDLPIKPEQIIKTLYSSYFRSASAVKKIQQKNTWLTVSKSPDIHVLPARWREIKTCKKEREDDQKTSNSILLIRQVIMKVWTHRWLWRKTGGELRSAPPPRTPSSALHRSPRESEADCDRTCCTFLDNSKNINTVKWLTLDSDFRPQKCQKTPIIPATKTDTWRHWMSWGMQLLVGCAGGQG